MSTTTITVAAEAMPDELAAIGDGLAAFNQADVGPSGRLAVTVLARDETNAIVGGISGYTAWGWLYVQWLWIAEALRGQGMAGQMLEAAETEARKRGCHAAYIDTFNPVALKVYQKQGYLTFGELANFPPGRTRTFLQKPL
ncbi:GNAT superfamily N-acetyltransferase [Devosia sp. UYZn731]|uniref:GNAT family N-acetyltransferase n=1 Tax=Devosia sp. UYZn731 TaxID=3156345 RepID=UPI003394EFE3